MQLTRKPDVGTPQRNFIPADFNPADTESLRESVDLLLARAVDTPDELEDFLRDWSELTGVVEAEKARRYIAKTCDTVDETIRDRFLSYEREVVPLYSQLNDSLDRKYLASPARDSLPARYGIFDRKLKTKAELFREENIPLETEETELYTKYMEIQGVITVELDGETLTAQQCSALLEKPDRELRERAFRKLAVRRLQDSDKIEELFDQMLAIRHQVALNAGFDNYRDYRFQQLCRFAYGPAQCADFHSAVEEIVVPAVADLTRRRIEKLGIDSLRPWDRVVSPFGRPPCTPFATEKEYIEKTQTLFRAVDPVFEKEFDILDRNGLLDLMSRPGKAPGGYMYSIEDMRLPFIFFNAVGTHSDIQTLLHEGGHAFHTIATRGEPLGDYRSAPMEFCEVASMSMELFGLERIDAIYDSQDAREAKYLQFESIVDLFGWIATIDAFQHWLYTHPGHSRDERREKWIDLAGRFAPHIDWGDMDDYFAYLWHRQGHLFHAPFYYIEYAIAQIGALQAWLLEREDHDGMVRAYQAALALGGSQGLPDLFETAGLRFAMGRDILNEIIPAVMKRIEELDSGETPGEKTDTGFDSISVPHPDLDS
ncbi:MAG: M3 family oligoendopeptidase [Planctomycetota bacterium]|nr:M3 family oligoendopeptidase [Planctomycetota bacterium]